MIEHQLPTMSRGIRIQSSLLKRKVNNMNKPLKHLSKKSIRLIYKRAKITLISVDKDGLKAKDYKILHKKEKVN